MLSLQGAHREVEGQGERGLLVRAFLNQTNLILLGGAALFSLALASPWPAVAGLVGEVLWLAVGAQSPRFRKRVGDEVAAEARAVSLAQRGAAMAGLDPVHAARVRALETMAAEIRRLAVERGVDPAPLDRPGRGLDALLLAFVRLASLHERLGRSQGGAAVMPVEQEIARITASLADEKDPSLRLSLRQALALAQRRLKQHEQMDIQRRALGIKMSTLEMSFDYLRSHIYGGSSPAQLAAELEELHQGVNFLPAAEAEVQVALDRLASPVITRVTGAGLSERTSS